MKGATRWDPVGVLKLEGTLVGFMACQEWYEYGRFGQPKRRTNAKGPCGAQASLYRFQFPYGYRAYCEEGHVCVFGEHSTQGFGYDPPGASD